jgi:chromosome segregation ATPase
MTPSEWSWHEWLKDEDHAKADRLRELEARLERVRAEAEAEAARVEAEGGMAGFAGRILSILGTDAPTEAPQA